MFSFKPYFIKKLLGWCFLFIIIVLLNQSCGGGGGGSSTGGSTPEIKSFKTILTPQELSSKYNNLPVYGVITVDFTKPLDITTKKSTGEVAKSDWLKLFIDSTPVEGKVYITNNDTSLMFIPSSFLKPDQNYTVIVGPTVKSKSGEILGETIKFSFTTSKKNDVLILNLPDYTQEGNSFRASITTALDEYSVIWDMDKNSTKDAILKDISSIDYLYDQPGIYTVSVKISDKYGREKTAEKSITVSANPLKILSSSDNLSDASEADINDIDSSTFKETVEEISGGKESVAEANISSESRASGILSRKVFCISTKPENLNKFSSAYIGKLVSKGEFLGIVSLEGFPAILSYEPDRNKLDIATFDYGVNIDQLRMGQFDIKNIHIPPIHNSPLLYFTSIEVKENIIERLKKFLPKQIDGTLPILYIKYGKVMLAVKEEKRGIGTDFVNFIIDEGKSAEDWLKKGLEVLNSIASSALYSALEKLKSYFNQIKSFDSFSKLQELISTARDIKNKFSDLENKFSDDPEGILSGYADPNRLFNDLKDYIYKQGSISIKGLINDASSKIKSAKTAIDKVVNAFQEHKDDFNSFIQGFIPDLSKDVRVYFLKNGSTDSIVLQNGPDSYTISYNMLHTFYDYSQAFAKKVGKNFPTKFLIDTIDKIINKFPSIMSGFFYDSHEHELRFLGKIGSTSPDECSNDLSKGICFGTYMSQDNLKAEIGANLSKTTGILIGFSPLNPILPPVDGSGALYSFLRKSLGVYPELDVNIRTKYRKNYIEISGSTHPSIGISGGVEFAVEVDYHVLFGGKGKVGLTLSVGVDPAGLIAGESSTLEGALKGIIKSAFNDSKTLLNQTQISTTNVTLPNGGTLKIPLLKFPSDEQFINFVDEFLTNINNKLTQQGLSNIVNSISFSIGLGTEGGAGAGAGGTGTGGVSVDGKVGFGIDIGFDLSTALQAIHFLKVSNVNSFIITPIKNLAALLEVFSSEGLSSFAPNNIVTQVIGMYFTTFKELLGNVSANTDYAKELFGNMASHMSMTVSFSEEAEGEAEEGASGSVEVSASPSISINGEAFFNALYGILNNPSHGVYLDHPGVYPQFSFGFPVSAEVEAGFDEGIKVTFTGSVQADFFSATLTIKNDPYNPNGIHTTGTNQTTLKLPVSAVLSADNTTVLPTDTIILTCSTTPSNASVSWYIEGMEVNSTGNITTDNGTVLAKVVSLQGKTMKLSNIVDKLDVICVATNSNEKKSFDSVELTVVHTLSGIPQLDIDNVTLLYDNSSINIIPVEDSAGYPVEYEVQISTTPDFSNILSYFATNSTHFELPSNLEGGKLYFIRVRATNGYVYTPYSETKSFCLPPKITLISPKDNSTVYAGKNVRFKANLHGADCYVEVSTDKNFNNIVWRSHYNENSDPNPWTPTKLGTYYWRITGYIDQWSVEGVYVGYVDVVSDYRTITVKLPPPKLKSPENNRSVSHNSLVSFSVYPVTGADHYQYQISNDRYFFTIISNDNSSSTTATIKMPIINSQPYTKEYYWRARTIKGNNYSDWSETRVIKVVNHPPLPRLRGLSTQNRESKVCVGDNATIAFYVHDQDNDNTTSYKIEILSKLTRETLGGYTINKNIENDAVISVNVPIRKEYAYGDVIIRIIPKDQWGSSMETAWGEDEVEDYFYNAWQIEPIDIINCPPPAPTRILGPDNVTLGRTVYLTVNPLVTDPDGDTIAYYEFSITTNNNTTMHQVQPDSGRNTATYSFTPDTTGAYRWKVRAVSVYRTDSGEYYQYGQWSEEQTFTVSEPSSTQAMLPANGSIILCNENGVILKAKPPESGSLKAVKFEWSTTDDFSEGSYYLTDISDDEGYFYHGIMPTCGKVWFWHTKVLYNPDIWSDWSETYCFTYLRELPIPEFYSDNDTFYDNSGTVKLNFNVREYSVTTNCLGDNGTFEYKICSDKECDRCLLSGNFTPGTPFDVQLDNGTYYFRGRQLVGGLDTEWSSPIQFVIKHNEPLLDSLVAHYSFDNCTAEDNSGNRNDGTIEGEPACSDEAAKNKSFYFNGDNQYIDISSEAFSKAQFALSAWINPDNITGKHFIAGSKVYGIFINNGTLSGYSCIEDKDCIYLKAPVGIPKNMWSFVALVYDGNEIRLYLNGKLANSFEITGATEPSSTFYIAAEMGDGGAMSDFFSGHVDEIRFYGRSLSENEIKDLMLEDENSMPDGLTPVSSFKVTPNEGSLQLKATLSCESVEGAIYRWDFDGDYYYDKETEESSIPHTYKKAGKFTPAVIVNTANGIYNWAITDINVYKPDGMILYWPLDGNGEDYSGSGYNLNIEGNPNWVQGEDSKALHLDNFSQYAWIEFGKEITLSSFTLSFWVKLDKSAHEGGYNMFIQGSENGDNQFNFAWYPDNQTLEVCLSGICKYTERTIDLVDERWHHLKYVYTEGTVTIYLDGDEFEKLGFSENASPTIKCLVIGEDQDNELCGGFDENQALFGSIDEIELYDSAQPQ